MSILIVDDNAQNLKLARVALQCEGFVVRTALDGEAAIELVRKLPPRLILMDIQLPGLDGLEVTRRLKANAATRAIIVIAVSAYAMKGDREEAMKAGCDGYITKPIDPISLPRQLGEYLGGMPPRPVAVDQGPAAPAGEVGEVGEVGEIAEVGGTQDDNRPPILVIEDNPTTRKMFRISLERAGYRVVEVHDGRAALAFVEHCTPALIIQDLNLPDMDGLDLARSLHAHLGEAAVPIICVSGFLSRIDEARALEGGFAQVIVKPVDPQQLIEVARLHLTTFPSADAKFGQGRRVLVVDDDPLQRKLLQIWLTAAGFDVGVAEDGEAALATARSAPPCIVVSDVLMPKMDGFALCLALRTDAELSHIPVLLTSAAYIDKADRDFALQLGASDMIAKAKGLDVVAAAVAAVLEMPPPPLPQDAAASFEAEHGKRGLWQLERQVFQNTSLLQRTAQQEAQLAVLAGVAESLAKNELDNAVLGDALASCLDMAGISKGALYLAEADRRLALQHQIGFSPTETARLRVAFGFPALLAELALRGNVVLIPSVEVSGAVAEQLLIEAGTTGLLLVPVTWGTHSYGAVLLGARLEDICGEDALAFARVLGAQMGQAIGLARSFANLAASELRYRTLTENADEAIVLVSLEGVIRESNRRCSEILGYGMEELVGRHVSDLAAPGREQELISRFEEQILAGSGRALPVELRKKDGASAMMEFSTAPVNIGGEALLLGIGRDVTEQLRAQEQLMVSDRMASIGTVAAGVAHEINNPLAAMMGNLELAVSHAELLHVEFGGSSRMAELREMLNDAREAGERVRYIVKDLKLFSRAEEDKRSAVDLERVLESTLRMASNEIRHRAKLVRNFGKVAKVDGNESRLGQVFLNLIINAAQAIPEGNLDNNEISITTSIDVNGNVVTEVRDTGPGIEPQNLKNLFTPFFTTKAPGVGTGLGLSICQRIVTELGGEITVKSTVGEGTVFRVVLRSSQLSENVDTPLPDSRAALRRGRVLLVDDDPMIGTIVRRILQTDHDVVTLTSAHEALDRITAGEEYDVILCDLMMPIMTGIEFHQQLASIFPGAADGIVFLTGGAFTASARTFLDEVANVRMEKPFHVQNLRSLVNDRVR